MATVQVRKYPGKLAWLMNCRYFACYERYYASSNNEAKAIKKALKKANYSSPKPYYVEVPVEAK